MRRWEGGNTLTGICHFPGCLRSKKRKVSSPLTFDMWTPLEVFELLDVQISSK